MFRIVNALFILTLIQLWWIAIWGLAYIVIDAIAGQSKRKEIYIYLTLLFSTVVILHLNPDMISRL
jgi:hypothetical protein